MDGPGERTGLLFFLTAAGSQGQILSRKVCRTSSLTWSCAGTELAEIDWGSGPASYVLWPSTPEISGLAVWEAP